MQQFTYTLKNDNINSYNRIAIIIQSLHLLFFIYSLLLPGYLNYPVLLITVCIEVIAILINTQFIKKPAPADNVVLTGIVYISFAIIWVFVFKNYFLAFAVILLAALNYFTAKKITIQFSDKGILLDTYVKKNIEWQQLNNVILKDGLLTIDFKNEKLIQQLIEEAESNEPEFNRFCQQQLTTINL